MENLVHDAKLQISELKIENQDLLTENRKLKVQIEEVNVESDLARADEMDVKIQELITQTGKYKSDYLRATQESQDLSAQLKASQSAMNNLQAGNDGLQTIVKTTQQMLQLTKEQYSEQVDTNTEMRRGLNEIYNRVLSQEAAPSSDGSESVGMTPQVQMDLVQAINRVLNPEKSAKQTALNDKEAHIEMVPQTS